MTPEEKLAELGYTLQEPRPYPPAMVAGKVVGNLLYLSGATPPDRFGTTWKGRVGETYTAEEGYKAARETAVVQLEMAKSILGDLGRIKQVVKVLGMVNCSPASLTRRRSCTGSRSCSMKSLASAAGTPGQRSACRPCLATCL